MLYLYIEIDNMELKTLSSICRWIPLNFDIDDDAFLARDLKDAARIWIKEIMKNSKKNYSREKYRKLTRLLKEEDLVVTVDNMIYMDVSKISWIKHFFNLDDK